MAPPEVSASPGRRRLALLGLASAAGLFVVGALVAFARAPGSTIISPSYLGILSEARTQRAVLVVSAGRGDAELWIRTLDPSIHIAGRSLELWALPRSKAPRSLGVVASADKAVLRLRGDADRALGDVTMLAVSLEPAGGSPSGLPTGPILYSGPCVRYW
jgi:anti-sigma-K factor RskA